MSVLTLGKMLVLPSIQCALLYRTLPLTLTLPLPLPLTPTLILTRRAPLRLTPRRRVPAVAPRAGHLFRGGGTSNSVHRRGPRAHGAQAARSAARRVGHRTSVCPGDPLPHARHRLCPRHHRALGWYRPSVSVPGTLVAEP